MTTKPVTIESVLAEVAEKAKKLGDNRRYITAHIRDLCGQYDAAVDATVIADFARRNGVTVEAPANIEDLAADLLDAVKQLPENLREIEELPPESITPAFTAPAATAAVPPPDVIVVKDPRAGTLRVTTHPPFPNLSRLTKTLPLVTVGGLYVLERDRWIKEMALGHEWLDTHNTGSEAGIAALAERLRTGKVGALVILNELIGHDQNRKLVDAAKAGKVPFTVAKRGNQGMFRQGLAEIEAELRKRG